MGFDLDIQYRKVAGGLNCKKKIVDFGGYITDGRKNIYIQFST